MKSSIGIICKTCLFGSMTRLLTLMLHMVLLLTNFEYHPPLYYFLYLEVVSLQALTIHRIRFALEMILNCQESQEVTLVFHYCSRKSLSAHIPAKVDRHSKYT